MYIHRICTQQEADRFPIDTSSAILSTKKLQLSVLK